MESLVSVPVDDSITTWVMVQGLGCAAWGLRFRVLGVGVLDFGSGVWCLVFGVWCLVFGVWCLVFGVWCLGFGVHPRRGLAPERHSDLDGWFGVRVWGQGVGSGCGVAVALSSIEVERRGAEW